MPTVPKYEVGQVKSRGINARQNIRVNQDTFGAGLAQQQIQSGRQTSQTADKVFNAALQAREHYEKGVLREMDNGFSSYIRDALKNPETGFLTKSGRSALDGKKAVVEGLDKYKEEASKDLDPRLLQQWNTMADSRYMSALDRIDTHAMAETKSYNQAQREARIDGQIDEMSINMYDDKAINMAKQVGLVEVNDKLTEMGINVQAPRDDKERDVIKQARLAFTTKGHTQVISSLLAAQQDTRAEEYYKKHKEEIDPSDHDTLENKLSSQTHLRRAQRETDTIMDNKELSYTQQLEEARKIDNPKIRAKTVELVKTRQAEIELNRKREQDQAYDQTQKHFIQGGGKENLPAGMWDSMSGAQQNAIQKVINERNKKALDPKNPIAAKAIFYHLEDMASEDFELFKQQNFALYMGIMEEGDIEKLRKMQKDVNEVKLSMTRKEMLKMSLTNMGLKYENYATDETVQQVVGEVDKRLIEYNKTHNKEPTQQEYNQMLFNMMSNTAKVNGWWVSDSEESVVAIDKDDFEDAYVTVNVMTDRGGKQVNVTRDVYLSEIPELEKNDIINKLESVGMPVTEQNIAKIWIEIEERENQLQAKAEGKQPEEVIEPDDEWISP